MAPARGAGVVKFAMQVVLWGGKFHDIGPAGEPRYEYDTREEAERMLRICYPDQLRLDRLDGTPGARVRVVEVPS